APDGSQPTPLSADGASPSAMPDGRVAYVVLRSKADPQDWAVDPITGTRTRLPFDFAQTPVWSPDGTRIAVGTGVAGETLSVGNADGSGMHEIAFAESPPHPAWSPDGTRIAFMVQPNVGLGVVDADGSNSRSLAVL